jgi:hypothetical protein
MFLSPAQATVFVLTDVRFADDSATASGYFVMDQQKVTAWDIQTSDLTHFSDQNFWANGQPAERSFLSFDAQHHPVVSIGRSSGEIHLATLVDMSSYYPTGALLALDTRTVYAATANYAYSASREMQDTWRNNIVGGSLEVVHDNDAYPEKDDIPAPGVAGAAPEPQTWAMILVGGLLVGGSLRRKRAT